MRDMRLDRVREDLLRARPGGTTVALVAHRWGLGHLGRFAAAYRERYGVSPRKPCGCLERAERANDPRRVAQEPGSWAGRGGRLVRATQPGGGPDASPVIGATSACSGYRRGPGRRTAVRHASSGRGSRVDLR